MTRPPPMTRTRVLLAAVTAWLLPSVLMPVLILSNDAATGTEAVNWLGSLLTGLIVGPVFGVIMGWPYLITAYGAWALLHRWRLSHPAVAVGVGLLEGMAVGASVNGLTSLGAEPGPFVGAIVIGGLTGFAVWRTAYGSKRARIRDEVFS